MTSKRPPPKKLILALVAVVAIVVILATPQCSVQHQALQFDIEQYRESLDPEICEIILEQIEAYNEQCGGSVEILDCG